MARRLPKRGWKQWSEAEARATLDAWRASGVSATEFARRRRISPRRLSYWQQRLARSGALAFVPVVATTRGEAHIEIERAGIVLRVRERVDPELLTGIVAALARVEAPC